MDDMTAFDRQLAEGLGRMAGPGRQIDAPAMVRTVATRPPRWRLQPMFGATKLVVAGAVVALFGGFLLAGALTQQAGEVLPAAVTESPSLTTNEALLSGMVIEEVEPGVFLIVNDGVRDLHAPPPLVGTRKHLSALIPEEMAIGQDGHPWLIRDGQLVRLGEPGEEALEARDSALLWGMAVDTAGTFWAMNDEGLTSFDDSTWTTHDWPDAFVPGWSYVEAAADGSVLVASSDRVARVSDGEWTLSPPWDVVTRGEVLSKGLVATNDTVWLGCIRHLRTGEAGCEGLLRFDGTAWDVVAPVPERPDLDAGPLAVGPDGTLWVYLWDPGDDDVRFLARLQDDRWSVFSAEDGVPVLEPGWEPGTDLSVDGDGTLWMAAHRRKGEEASSPVPGPLSFPNGVLSFDGTTWRQYLADANIQQVEAAGGYVWALDGADARGGGLYIITPEAVMEADAVAVEPDGEAGPVDTAATP